MLVGLSSQELVLLGSAVVPPIVAALVCWFVWKSGKRHDVREASAQVRNALSSRLERKVRTDFPADAVLSVLTRLFSLRLPLAEQQSLERIQTAIVLLAAGDPDRFEQQALAAERDWRDVLVFSGLGNVDWPERLDAELGPNELAS